MQKCIYIQNVHEGSLENHLLCFRPCSFTSKFLLILSDSEGGVEDQFPLNLEI